MLKKIATLGLMSSLLMLNACTTISKEQRQIYKAKQNQLKKAPVNILADSCITRIEVGDDDILYQQSIIANAAVTNTLKAKLESNGITVNNTYAPLVCGGVSNTTLTSMDIRRTHDSKDIDNTEAPLVTPENIYLQEENQAFFDLYTALYKISSSKKDQNSLDLNSATLSRLKHVLGTEKLFVTFVGASKPSFAAKMTLAIATTVVSGGQSTYSIKKGQLYNIYLVDLNSNTVEWFKQGGIINPNVNVFDGSVDGAYMIDILYPLFEK